jgi:hypothetical protein
MRFCPEIESSYVSATGAISIQTGHSLIRDIETQRTTINEVRQICTKTRKNRTFHELEGRPKYDQPRLRCRPGDARPA